ncbi:MAG: ABC transporter ATP-binding protein/permease [Rhodobacteraceae bacterium]|nr:ABC transporter ATP-binding protein/permease [Paracoccaceae bacterium]
MNALIQRLADLIGPFEAAEGPPPQTLMAFLRWCLKGAWPMFFLAFAMSAIAGTSEVVAAIILGSVIDSTTGDPATWFDTNTLLLAGFLGFFVVLRPIAFGASAALNSIMFAPNVNTLVQSRLHRWVLGHATQFFDDDFAGRIAQKQMQTGAAVTNVLVELISVVAFAAASVVGSILLLFTIDWKIALIVIVWFSVYLKLISWFMPRIRVRSKDRAAKRSNVSGQIVDTVGNIKTVKLFANSQHEDEAALDAMRGYRASAIEFGKISALFRLALMSIAGILPIVLILSAISLWTQGAASAGDIAAAGVISIRLSQMTGWVSFALMGLYANVGEIEDGVRTLTPPHTVTDRPDAPNFAPRQGEISFEGLEFTYGGGPGGVHGLDLTVAPGEKVGVVGASGAGKSTLVSLLLRLYDTEKGRVLVDGQDVSSVTQESLRRYIAMVTQDTAMFNRSARDNILYGRPDATEEEMIAASRQASAHEFIQDLADAKDRTGYGAHLGERGVKLSGGQRQRIALARAILKDAPILILDEATSALDSEVEAEIQDALAEVMEGKTVLAIAHRLSTLANMDRIIVMDQGRIVEEGTHRDLMARDGLYARYWNRQSGGFLGYEDAAE